jgi:hypothetical protein
MSNVKTDTSMATRFMTLVMTANMSEVLPPIPAY